MPGAPSASPASCSDTDAGARILIDTGFPPAYADDAAAAGRADGLDGFGAVEVLTRDNLLPGQLAHLGLTPADIDLTILTHGHIDHVGGLAQVAHAPILMTARERAEPRPLYHGDARPLDWPDAEYLLIDADTEICDGLIVTPTPGHTPGHLSALVDLPATGPVLLAADAISRPAELLDRFPDAMDPEAAIASGARLLALAEQARAMLIFGHHPGQWPHLPKAPAFLD